jgi:hypothetical protein
MSSRPPSRNDDDTNSIFKQPNRHCERSEAIHIAARKKVRVDCFASLAMTMRHDSAISPRVFAQGFVRNVPPFKRRAWGMPGAECTRSLAGRKTSHTSSNSHHEFTGKTPSIPARNGFTAYFVISPAIGLFCHRRLTDMAGPRPVGPTSPPQDLIPASRYQDHTTSLYAAPVYAKRLRRGLAPFVSLPPIAHGKPALPSRVMPDAAASTASCPALLTLRNAPRWDRTRSI